MTSKTWDLTLEIFNKEKLTIEIYGTDPQIEISWGDGSGIFHLKKKGVVVKLKDHIYSNPGKYIVQISGSFGSEGNIRVNSPSVTETSAIPYIPGLKNFAYTFAKCSLISIPEDLFWYNPQVCSQAFFGTFYRCIHLKEIPPLLFKFSGETEGFSHTFDHCSSLTQIPPDLFRYNPKVSSHAFFGTFAECFSLKEIPPNLFAENLEVSDCGFCCTFFKCTSLQNIPEHLFKNNKKVAKSGFKKTFFGCSSLEQIPFGLFSNNPEVSSSGFEECFMNCSSLKELPEDLFTSNTKVSESGFYGTFKNCSSLKTIPPKLFEHNPEVSYFGFCETFSGCKSLVLGSDVFGFDRDRFVGKSCKFIRFAYLVGSDLPQPEGEAPPLWSDFVLPNFTDLDAIECFYGTNVTNFDQIPELWVKDQVRTF